MENVFYKSKGVNQERERRVINTHKRFNIEKAKRFPRLNIYTELNSLEK